MSIKLFNIFFGTAGLILYVISYFSRELNLPFYYENFCCIDDRFLNIFLIFIPFVLFSVWFFYLSDKSILKFSKISFIYLFIYSFIYFIIPTQGDGFLWLQRETISLLGSIIYFTMFILLFFTKLKNEQ